MYLSANYFYMFEAAAAAVEVKLAGLQRLWRWSGLSAHQNVGCLIVLLFVTNLFTCGMLQTGVCFFVAPVQTCVFLALISEQANTYKNQ